MGIRKGSWGIPGSSTLKALARLLGLRGPQRRSELLTRLRFGSEQVQAATYTTADRYPALFHACSLLLHSRTRPRLLSFGCSTGEECFALAGYMPTAQIVGVELNRWCLRQGRRANRDPRIRFLHPLSPEFAAEPRFDAIFCLAVLQDERHRTQNLQYLDRGFTFARFEAKLRELDRKLLPGGLLFLDHCDFRFTETNLSRGYDVVDFPGNRRTRSRPLFNSSNHRIAEEYIADRCFRKRALLP